MYTIIGNSHSEIHTSVKSEIIIIEQNVTNIFLIILREIMIIEQYVTKIYLNT